MASGGHSDSKAHPGLPRTLSSRGSGVAVVRLSRELAFGGGESSGASQPPPASPNMFLSLAEEGDHSRRSSCRPAPTVQTPLALSTPLASDARVRGAAAEDSEATPDTGGREIGAALGELRGVPLPTPRVENVHHLGSSIRLFTRFNSNR